MAAVPRRCFVSYTRHDNSDFDDIVDRLTSKMAAMYEAETGTKLDVFVDRDSIGWGEDWRDKIAEAINGAVLFIPVITMRYFASEACTDELIAFHAAAKNREMTDLIRPLVLMGAAQIRPDHPRAEVRLIESLNYKPIREAYLEGFGSSTWRKLIQEIVGDLIVALEAVEERLEERVAQEALAEGATSGGGGPDSAQVAVDADLTVLQDQMPVVEQSVQTFMDDFGKFSEVLTEATDGRDFGSMTRNQQKAALLTLARRLKLPAVTLEQSAQSLQSATVELDLQLRSFASEISQIDNEAAENALADMRSGASVLADQLSDVDSVMHEIMQGMQLMALMNASLRSSIRPAANAISALQSTLSIMHSWSTI